jgi:hypothetical protein
MTGKTTLFKCCILLALLLFAACRNKTENLLRNHAVELNDSCLTEEIHHYKVYIPSVAVRCDAMPLLIIIDPHADAQRALEHFKAGAEKYKFLLVASGTLKNNYSGYMKSLDLLIDDVRKKYPVNESVYIAGFSGGARMALSYNEQMSLNGIIACGALAAPEQLTSINCRVIGIIGIADFNFIESAQYIFKPEESPTNLLLEISGEDHGWPTSGQLTNALGYLHVEDMEGNACCHEKTVFRNFASTQKRRIDSSRLAGDLLGAGLIARNLARLDDFSEYDDFISVRNSIEYSTDFNVALDQLRESIRFELNMRNAYSQAMLSNEISWWEKEVTSLKKIIESEDDYFKVMACMRIKGFLGIMCYTLTGNALKADDLKYTERLLAIYKLVEPGNPDMIYNYALYYHKTNAIDSVPGYLKLAIDSGFTDRQKLVSDFGPSVAGELMPLPD